MHRSVLVMHTVESLEFRHSSNLKVIPVLTLISYWNDNINIPVVIFQCSNLGKLLTSHVKLGGMSQHYLEWRKMRLRW